MTVPLRVNRDMNTTSKKETISKTRKPYVKYLDVKNLSFSFAIHAWHCPNVY